MRTISAFEKDIEFQLEFIENFVPLKPILEHNQERAIICGTGDSYVAALVCEIFSNFKVKAFDPLDLLKNRELMIGKDLYLISISGNTISNVKLAKIQKNTIAVTANPKSKLGKACKKVISLSYKNSGIFTSGSIGFLASMMKCISLVTEIKIKNPSKLFFQAKKISFSKINGKVFFLGNMQTFPIAMFAAAKFYEVLGIDAHYERIEQFSHMGIFSVKKGDSVIIFEEKTSHNSQLMKNLKKCGLDVTRIEPASTNKFEIVLFYTFVAEFLALNQAKRRGLKDCYFVRAKTIRNASSSMIY